MTNETPLHQELQLQLSYLLNGVVNFSTRHLAEAETDLSQTSLLLDEAINRLTGSFFALHAAISAQQELVALVVAGRISGTAGRAELQQHAQSIVSHVSASVTSLQFQDMTNQLLERTAKRLGGLREMLKDTAAVASALRSVEDSSVEHLQIDAVIARLARQSETLDDALFKAVHQEHLESGEITLF